MYLKRVPHNQHHLGAWRKCEISNPTPYQDCCLHPIRLRRAECPQCQAGGWWLEGGGGGVGVGGVWGSFSRGSLSTRVAGPEVAQREAQPVP